VHIQYVDRTNPTYQPGVCNISPGEIARRRRFGIVGIAAAIVLAVVLVAVGAPAIARGLVLFPLWGGIVSLEQARRHFCAGFAYAGIHSAEGSEAREAVADRDDLARDRATARWMVVYSGAIAAVITVAFVVLPL
jgi:hypothetical protein